MRKKIFKHISTECLAKIDIFFQTEDCKMIVKSFLNEIFTQKEIDNICDNYEITEKFFFVSLDSNVDYYKEFLIKILRFYRLPLLEYLNYERMLHDTYEKINRVIENINRQLEENKQSLKDLEEKISFKNAQISKMKERYQDCKSLVRERENITYSMTKQNT